MISISAARFGRLATNLAELVANFIVHLRICQKIKEDLKWPFGLLVNQVLELLSDFCIEYDELKGRESNKSG